MAMRRFNQFMYSLEVKPVRLFMKATIGSAGAITLDAANSKGIKSVAKQATAGQYKITLSDSYFKLMGLDLVIQNAAGIPASGVVGLLASGTAVGASGGGTIMVQLSNAGVATNPASGDVVLCEIALGDSNV